MYSFVIFGDKSIKLSYSEARTVFFNNNYYYISVTKTKIVILYTATTGLPMKLTILSYEFRVQPSEINTPKW